MTSAHRESVTVRVPAKVNLRLAVGPPRADGYHDLVNVFHAVSLSANRCSCDSSPYRPHCKWQKTP